MKLNLKINGEIKCFDIKPGEFLSEVLRKEGYKGLKHGCKSGRCGACTVLLNGEPIVSCITLAGKVEGQEITTIEGLGTPEKLHPLQEAFLDKSAVQCGFCTSGVILSAKALLDKNNNPTEKEIKEALVGNYCRCTGYVKQIEAIKLAAEKMRKSIDN